MHPMTRQMKKLGDEMENVYRMLYEGKMPYNYFYSNIMAIVNLMCCSGVIDNTTLDRLKNVLSCNISVEVISTNSCELALLDKIDSRVEKVLLKDIIRLIMYELTNDKRMSKKLCGCNDYSTIKRYINKLDGRIIVNTRKKGCLDYCACKDVVYFTDMNEENCIALFCISKSEAFDLDNAELLWSGLSERKIYTYNDMISVNANTDNFIVYEDGKMITKKSGKVISAVDDGFVYLYNERIFLCNKSKSRILISKDVKNGVLLNGDQTFWKRFDCYGDKSYPEIVWQAILNMMYEIDFECRDSLRNKIEVFKIFAQAPSPFSMEKIMEALNYVERFVYSGEVIHGNHYTECVLFLKKLTKENDILRDIDEFICQNGGYSCLGIINEEKYRLIDYVDRIQEQLWDTDEEEDISSDILQELVNGISSKIDDRIAKIDGMIAKLEAMELAESEIVKDDLEEYQENDSFIAAESIQNHDDE